MLLSLVFPEKDQIDWFLKNLGNHDHPELAIWENLGKYMLTSAPHPNIHDALGALKHSSWSTVFILLSTILIRLILVTEVK